MTLLEINQEIKKLELRLRELRKLKKSIVSSSKIDDSNKEKKLSFKERKDLACKQAIERVDGYCESSICPNNTLKTNLVPSHILRRNQGNPHFKADSPDSPDDIIAICKKCDSVYDKLDKHIDRYNWLYKNGFYKIAEKIKLRGKM